ncbi:hypothetical protein DCS_01103 [Drechmeria coniospora]|uniref:Uncharacterized protein n=1 Tax=Drechmeria coniospora TaxID=98403 RepID=A0A151GS85_DRECN|nr:hypothetical protein DCS_01103 [Drechmeria coniospora]KYK59969.1 hypothetical protein DCS_01103 [Drechmeria coniospora]
MTEEKGGGRGGAELVGRILKPNGAGPYAQREGEKRPYANPCHCVGQRHALVHAYTGEPYMLRAGLGDELSRARRKGRSILAPILLVPLTVVEWEKPAGCGRRASRIWWRRPLLLLPSPATRRSRGCGSATDTNGEESCRGRLVIRASRNHGAPATSGTASSRKGGRGGSCGARLARGGGDSRGGDTLPWRPWHAPSMCWPASGPNSEVNGVEKRKRAKKTRRKGNRRGKRDASRCRRWATMGARHQCNRREHCWQSNAWHPPPERHEDAKTILASPPFGLCSPSGSRFVLFLAAAREPAIGGVGRMDERRGMRVGG